MSTEGPYVRGQVARITAAFTDAATGSPILPATVVARVNNGYGTHVGTYVYGAGTLIATASGTYRLDIPLDSIGDWQVRVEGLGVNQSADEFALHVRASRFD